MNSKRIWLGWAYLNKKVHRPWHQGVYFNLRGWGWGVVDRRTVLVWGERERKERKREERERKRRREERGRKGVHPSGLSSLPSISNQGGRGGLGALGALFECL